MASEREVTFNFGINFDDNEDEINDYINNQKAKATKNKDKTDLKTFDKFRTENGFNTVEIEKLSALELNAILCQFFMKSKKREIVRT